MEYERQYNKEESIKKGYTLLSRGKKLISSKPFDVTEEEDAKKIEISFPTMIQINDCKPNRPKSAESAIELSDKDLEKIESFNVETDLKSPDLNEIEWNEEFEEWKEEANIEETEDEFQISKHLISYFKFCQERHQRQLSKFGLV